MGFGRNHAGPASQTMAQHHFTIGPMFLGSGLSFSCCRVAPLIATCAYVLKGVSLTILYYILVE